MNLMKYRKIWYGLSLFFIVPGTAALLLWGLNPSIDFTGGSKMEISGTQDIKKAKELATDSKLKSVVVQKVGKDTISLRFKEINQNEQKDFVKKVEESFGVKNSAISFETVGPSISSELTRNSFIAIGLSSLVIILYIAYSFRKVPYPAKSWEFGVMAVLATLHDALLLVGVYAILGHYAGVEIDPLIITAILTVIGFSVHDTIVIFDRIRENLVKKSGSTFEEVVNESVFEMLPRTLNTSYLAWVILIILFLFGGETIKWFVFALMIGMVSGTFSSILNASPLLVTWQEIKVKFSKRR